MPQDKNIRGKEKEQSVHLGISYNLFDGEELLTPAIKAIRNKVDYISVVYQNISNKNESIDLNFEWLDLVDVAIKYEPDLNKEPRWNETNKRNIGLNASKTNRCTHHASLDVDEFYTADSFELVKELKEDFSLVKYVNYFKSPCWKVVDERGNQIVTFVHKISAVYDQNAHFGFPVDQTRRLKGVNSFRVYNREEIEMQHMTFVRNDIGLKIRNSSSDQHAEMLDVYHKYDLGQPLVLPPMYRSVTTIEVENQFGIRSEHGIKCNRDRSR